MKSALRKLIAFVFLLGIFWYVYQDVDNIWNPGYMSAIGGLVLVFAAFWLFVPLAVVRMRIWRRERQNRRGYAVWLEEIGSSGLHPHRRSRRMNVDPGEDVWFHEKGTLYVRDCPELDACTVAGQIGDVAFPREPRSWRKAQRTHCHFTSRRILFLGRELDCDLPLAEVAAVRATTGGLVIEVRRAGRTMRFAFTFTNPLIAADVLGRLREGRIGRNAAPAVGS